MPSNEKNLFDKLELYQRQANYRFQLYCAWIDKLLDVRAQTGDPELYQTITEIVNLLEDRTQKYMADQKAFIEYHTGRKVPEIWIKYSPQEQEQKDSLLSKKPPKKAFS